jgi:hypothetical protein
LSLRPSFSTTGLTFSGGPTGVLPGPGNSEQHSSADIADRSDGDWHGEYLAHGTGPGRGGGGFYPNQKNNNYLIASFVGFTDWGTFNTSGTP